MFYHHNIHQMFAFTKRIRYQYDTAKLNIQTILLFYITMSNIYRLSNLILYNLEK